MTLKEALVVIVHGKVRIMVENAKKPYKYESFNFDYDSDYDTFKNEFNRIMPYFKRKVSIISFDEEEQTCIVRCFVTHKAKKSA